MRCFPACSLSQGKTDASCPCCLRDFVDMDETTRFMNQMNALVDPDTSELMEMISKKNKESTESLERFEVSTSF